MVRFNQVTNEIPEKSSWYRSIIRCPWMHFFFDKNSTVDTLDFNIMSNFVEEFVERSTSTFWYMKAKKEMMSLLYSDKASTFASVFSEDEPSTRTETPPLLCNLVDSKII